METSDDFEQFKRSVLNLRRYRSKRRIGKNTRKRFRMKELSIEERKWMDGLLDDSDMRDEIFSSVVNRQEFFMAGSSLNDHYISKVMSKRIENGLSTITKTENLLCDQKDWEKYVRKNFSDYQILEFSTTAGMFINKENFCFVDYSVNSNCVTIKIYGDSDYVEKIYQKFSKDFNITPCYIEWVYGSDGSSVNIPLLNEKIPVTEMYSFLKDETIEEYYERYKKSSASILLLIGPPGTGKTTFIRGFLHHTQKNAIVTYDEKILERDYVFARFIEDEVDVMVIEDADNFLKSRKESNNMMHRFLNIGDGLISTKGKKLIFSTNLPSISDVDDALIRPGRCFDILHFENYNLEQARKLAKKLDINFSEKEDSKSTYSLAEIFNENINRSNKKVSAKIGFI